MSKAKKQFLVIAIIIVFVPAILGGIKLNSYLIGLKQRFEKTAETFRLAKEYYRKGRIDNALSLLRPWLATNPGISHGHYLLGLCLLKKGDDAGAISAFNEAFALNASLGTQIAQAFDEKVVEAMDRNDTRTALDYFNHMGRYDSYALTTRHTEAVINLLKAEYLVARPKDYSLGVRIVHLLESELARADASQRRALLLALADMQAEQGEFWEAEQATKKFLETRVAPSQQELLFLGNIYRKIGKLSEARSCFQRLNDPAVEFGRYLGMARISAAIADGTEAAKYYEQAISRLSSGDSRLPEILYEKAELEAQNSRLNRQLQNTLTHLVSLSPPAYYAKLARNMLRKSRVMEKCKLLKQAIETRNLSLAFSDWEIAGDFAQHISTQIEHWREVEIKFSHFDVRESDDALRIKCDYSLSYLPDENEESLMKIQNVTVRYKESGTLNLFSEATNGTGKLLIASGR